MLHAWVLHTNIVILLKFLNICMLRIWSIAWLFNHGNLTFMKTICFVFSAPENSVLALAKTVLSRSRDSRNSDMGTRIVSTISGILRYNQLKFHCDPLWSLVKISVLCLLQLNIILLSKVLSWIKQLNNYYIIVVTSTVTILKSKIQHLSWPWNTEKCFR